MGTFLTIMFCLFVVVVFIALIVVFCVAVSAFGEEFYDYVQEASEEYFELKRHKAIKIKFKKRWSDKDTYMEIDLFGTQCTCGSVAEMVAWLKEQGVE